LVLVLKKYGGLGLGLETQSLGLGLDKEVLFTSLDFIGAKDDGSGCDNWSHEMCKAAVKSSLPPTNRHPAFYRPDALPVAQPTVPEH